MAVAILLSISVAASASGQDFQGLLACWTGDRIWFMPDQVIPAAQDDIQIPEEPGKYASLQEALEGYGLFRPVAPRWLPDGFELTGLEVADWSEMGRVMFSALYDRDGDSVVVFVELLLDVGRGSAGGSTDFQKDEGDPVPYEVDGVVHMLATNAGRPIAVWVNGPTECGVSGDITMDELKQMIDSIYKK